MLGERSAKVSAIAAVCGLLVLISLFLPWAQVVCEIEPCQYPTGWDVLRVLDVPIALLAVAAAALALLGMLRPVPIAALALAAAGGLAIVLIFLAPLVEDRGVRPVDFGGSWFLGVFGALGVIATGLAVYFMVRESSDDGEEGEEEPQG